MSKKRKVDSLSEEINYIPHKKEKDNQSIWYYYLTSELRPEIKSSKCKLCGREVDNKLSSTGRMWEHLKKDH